MWGKLWISTSLDWGHKGRGEEPERGFGTARFVCFFFAAPSLYFGKQMQGNEGTYPVSQSWETRTQAADSRWVQMPGVLCFCLLLCAHLTLVLP